MSTTRQQDTYFLNFNKIDQLTVKKYGELHASGNVGTRVPLSLIYIALFVSTEAKATRILRKYHLRLVDRISYFIFSIKIVWSILLRTFLA